VDAPLPQFPARVVARLGEVTGALPEPLAAPVLTLVEHPGKCLRSTLLGACAALGPADPARLVRLGAVVELLHLASLVHDDVIDRAAVRRGRAAAHVVAGNEVATLAGLACFALAGTEAGDLGEGVARAVSEAAAELSYGELLDVQRGFDTSLTLADYVELVERKTGTLFRLACWLGAAEAGLDAGQRRALARFGLDLGVAFQILDDCLDLQPGGLDKPCGTDHLLGLFGAPTLCALRDDPSGELSRLLLSPSFGAADLASVRALVTACGALSEAAELAREHYERALRALDGVPAGAARAALAATAATVWPDAR
jgi:geranylgeranyl pyrophosphate synthase